MSACSESEWLDTEIYSPAATDLALAINAATPALRIAPTSGVAAATPEMSEDTEMILSFAQSTDARSQRVRWT